MNTKDLIYKYLKTETNLLSNEDFSLLTTTVIAEELHISRSLTSQYLNELFKEGMLIKIVSRPVFFLHKECFQKNKRMTFSQTEYLSIKELMDTIQKYATNDIFETVIGYDDSLLQVIQQIKSAVFYPNQGLPMIFHGKVGSGKSYLAKVTHRFCVDNKLIGKNQYLHYLKHIGHTDTIDSVLFGDETTGGLLEQKDIGILYIEDSLNFDKSIQYKLSNIIRDGYYMKQKKVIKVNCRFIFGVVKDPSESFAATLLQHLPIVCRIPNFDQKPSHEKEQFIIKFFTQEQNKLDYKIEISYKLLEALMKPKLEQDVHELKKSITRICASALNSVSDGVLRCHVYHLYDENIQYTLLENSGDLERVIKIEEYKTSESSSKIIQLYQSILDSFVLFQTNSLSYSDMLNQNYESMRNYYDLLIFEQNYSQKQASGIEKVIDEVFELKKIQSRINLPSNCSFVLSRMLVSSTQGRTCIERWMLRKQDSITLFLEFLNEKMNDIYRISQEISKLIYQATELELTDFNMIFLMLNIYFYNDNIQHKDTAAIIVSHGYSTASSIADAANQLLEEHIFDAFDMSLETSSEEIIVKVNDYISAHSHYKNLILLVDMGSLELIGDKVISDINVGVINNISTSIAVQIGYLIRQEKTIEEILEKAAQEAIVKYKILNRAQKEKIVLFVSDAGIGVADRMVNLFKQSLPKSIDLRFISYDFKELLSNGLDDILFFKFEVVLMIKPYSLPIESVRSISLEDIVSFKDISIVDEALASYLDKEETEVFNRNLLKNFSLENVMKNLTILNARRLLDFVSESTLSLERKNNWKFQNKTIVGIYIHVCFLIERLVTKTPIADYENVESFAKEQKAFIKDVNESFGAMLTHYNVEMPLSEIALLYDYIKNDKERSKEEGDEF